MGLFMSDEAGREDKEERKEEGRGLIGKERPLSNDWVTSIKA